MQTSLRCAKHVLFFSDLEQDIGQYHLYDTFENFSTETLETPDFEFYRKQLDVCVRTSKASTSSLASRKARDGAFRSTLRKGEPL